MLKTNDCTKQISLEQRAKSASRLKEEDSVINRLDNIWRQVYKWSKQRDSVLGEKFFYRFQEQIFAIENTFYSFDDVIDEEDWFDLKRL